LERPERSELAKQWLGLFQVSFFPLSVPIPSQKRSGIPLLSGLFGFLVFLLVWLQGFDKKEQNLAKTLITLFAIKSSL